MCCRGNAGGCTAFLWGVYVLKFQWYFGTARNVGNWTCSVVGGRCVEVPSSVVFFRGGDKITRERIAIALGRWFLNPDSSCWR